jgi:hypothetical protein
VKDVPIPHEEGEWLRLRMLGGKKLQEARDVNSDRALATFRKMGAEGIQAIQKMTRQDADAALKTDPLAEYDIDVLLRAGIVAWSYDEKVTPQAVEELDEATRKWAATEILKMSLPGVFEVLEAVDKAVDDALKNL